MRLVEWAHCRRDVLPLRIEPFLSADSADAVLGDLLERRAIFSGLTGARNFMRLPAPLDQVPRFSDRVLDVLPIVERQFGIDLSQPSLELYVHAYNDGTFFGSHADDHGGANWRRRISCVYYLHRRPRTFEGGTLAVQTPSGRTIEVEPIHNSIVFFPSSWIHEVRLVRCPSRRFEDSRFAINVWVC
jgi:predicted 2-oxoglutarate/Fe(II)-dependent dioxygenase YbiX